MTDGHLFIKSHLQRPEPSTPGGHREALLCPGPDAPAGPKWAGAAGRARAGGLLPGTPCSGQRWRSPPGGSRPARSADLSLRYRAGPPTPPPALPRPGSAEPSALRCASRRLRARGARGRSPPCGVWGPLGAGWASPSAQVPQATTGAPRGRMTPPPRAPTGSRDDRRCCGRRVSSPGPAARARQVEPLLSLAGGTGVRPAHPALPPPGLRRSLPVHPAPESTWRRSRSLVPRCCASQRRRTRPRPGRRPTRRANDSGLLCLPLVSVYPTPKCHERANQTDDWRAQCSPAGDA